jgi:hypothetical protein
MRRLSCEFVCVVALACLLLSQALYAQNCSKGCKAITCYKKGTGPCEYLSEATCIPGSDSGVYGDFWAIGPSGTCPSGWSTSINRYSCDCEAACLNDQQITTQYRERQNCMNLMYSGTKPVRACE